MVDSILSTNPSLQSLQYECHLTMTWKPLRRCLDRDQGRVHLVQWEGRDAVRRRRPGWPQPHEEEEWEHRTDWAAVTRHAMYIMKWRESVSEARDNAVRTSSASHQASHSCPAISSRELSKLRKFLVRAHANPLIRSYPCAFVAPRKIKLTNLIPSWAPVHVDTGTPIGVSQRLLAQFGDYMSHHFLRAYMLSLNDKFLDSKSRIHWKGSSRCIQWKYLLYVQNVHIHNE